MLAQARLLWYSLLTPQGMKLWRRSWSLSYFMEWIEIGWMTHNIHYLRNLLLFTPPKGVHSHPLVDGNYSSSMKLSLYIRLHGTTLFKGPPIQNSVMARVGNRKLDSPTEDKHRNSKDNLNIVLSDNLAYFHNDDIMYTASPSIQTLYMFTYFFWLDIISKHGFILSPLKLHSLHNILFSMVHLKCCASILSYCTKTHVHILFILYIYKYSTSSNRSTAFKRNHYRRISNSIFFRTCTQQSCVSVFTWKLKEDIVWS